MAQRTIKSKLQDVQQQVQARQDVPEELKKWADMVLSWMIADPTGAAVGTYLKLFIGNTSAYQGGVYLPFAYDIGRMIVKDVLHGRVPAECQERWGRVLDTTSIL